MMHLEGMGVTGALLAVMLNNRGVEFTWHDSDHPYTAWKACTGAVYPSGDAGDEQARKWWLGFYEVLADEFAQSVEPAAYWYSQKHPPHGGKYEPKIVLGGLKLAPHRSVHLNAQQFVTDVRKKFRTWRLPSGAGEPYIVTHGFGLRLDHYFWGWTRVVRLGYSDQIISRSGRYRPAFYFRQGRLFFYAYPMAGTEYWYAGSSLLRQQVGDEKHYEIEPKYQTWKRHFTELGEGHVRVEQEGPVCEGWRPAGVRDSMELVQRGGKWLVPPLWHSGVRQFPLVWNEIERRVL